MSKALYFGKFKGIKMSVIAEKDRWYLFWIAKNVKIRGTHLPELAQLLGDDCPKNIQDIMTIYNIPIEQRAREHKEKYPTFDLERFMEYIGKRKYSTLTISELNQNRKRRERSIRGCCVMGEKD